MRRTAWDRHADAWEGLKATFHALMRGQEQLGLPALGGLFAHGVVPDLENSLLENRRLLAAIWRLAWLRPAGQPLTRVNWRDMETEELGSVYESLLELTPRASADARTFDFAEGDETRGNARKVSGSYYTPDALVKLLLDSTLEPVLDAAEARNPADPTAEILKLSIIDPASGSGHFLLGAARRAAARIAKCRSPGAPSQEEFQHALREVVSHCIYGVDRNPMAVELCKVALWIEALEPGKPLTFLDSHIRCGDSLIGVFDYEMLRKGIPDEAYQQLTGDDKETAKAYSKFNKQQREGKGATGFLPGLRAPADLIDAARALTNMPEDTLDEIGAKRTAFERLHSGSNWLNLKIASDCFIAAFFTPKNGDAPGAAELARPIIPLTDHVWAAVRGQTVYEPLVALADRFAHEVDAFHWLIEFPHIFARGGFDVVIGNPPWERIRLQEQEFFASRSPEIATAPNKAARERLINALKNAEPDTAEGRLLADFHFAKRAAEAGSEFARSSGRYPLTGTGDLNTYALFAEHFSRLAHAEGRSGVIVPTGIATDSSTSAFFGKLIDSARIISLYDFQTGHGFFDRIGHARFKFCILTVMGSGGRSVGPAEFVFFVRQTGDLDQKERFFALSPDQIARLNPNTKTAPVFRSRADADLTTKIYSRAPVLIEERPFDRGGDVNTWGITFQRMFDMSSDSGLFATALQLETEGWTRDGTGWVRELDTQLERRVPLYEAKMVHHFDHRWATFDGGSTDDDGARDVTFEEKRRSNFEPSPRYWVPEDEVTLRAARVPASLKRAFREQNAQRCMKTIAEWLIGYFASVEQRAARENDLTHVLGRDQPWRTVLGTAPDRFLREPKTLANGVEFQRETPLTNADLEFLVAGTKDPIALTAALIGRKQPRWLTGWRDITNATNERTVVGGVLPLCGVGNNLPIWYVGEHINGALAAAFVGLLSSLTFDFVARHKLGGTHLNFFIAQQLPALSPTSFTEADLAIITPRVLELTYTSQAARAWAEDLGYCGHPFPWDETRRAELRSELDAVFARKYGLTRDELRYVLDPSDVRGADYPSETFRGLKGKEEARFGEYRTRRLVLEAWDRFAVTSIGSEPINVRAQTVAPATLRDGAWARPLPASPGDTGAILAAILKTMSGPLPAREVRLATVLALEPRLLVPHLDLAQSAEWQRLVGSEAAPLTRNAISFTPRVDRTWGAAVISHRGNGRLVENLASGTWAPGAGLGTIDTAGWPDGRAGMVMGVLAQISTDSVISAMPDEIRGWIDAAAA